MRPRSLIQSVLLQILNTRGQGLYKYLILNFMERVKFDVCPSTLKVSSSAHEYDKRIRQLRNLLDEVYRNINTVTVIDLRDDYEL